jgi:hypothetical protein
MVDKDVLVENSDYTKKHRTFYAISQMGLLNRISVTTFARIPHLNTLYENLRNDDLDKATIVLKNYIFRLSFFKKLKNEFFTNHKQRTTAELVKYLKDSSPKEYVDLNYRRQAGFISGFLDKLGVLHYDQDLQTLFWRNGVEQIMSSDTQQLVIPYAQQPSENLQQDVTIETREGYIVISAKIDPASSLTEQLQRLKKRL